MNPWKVDAIPSLMGKTVIVTGANSGIGLEATKIFVRKGAHVILACRNLEKAQIALAMVEAEKGRGGSAEIEQLDLASLISIRQFAYRVMPKIDRLDLLINNAGVMAIPPQKTADGFEMQFGTNHLGHFALTGLLLGRLLATPNSRIVNVSSAAHKFGKINFADLQSTVNYKDFPVYGQSKLANLLFTFELQRRLEAIGSNTISVACHPGFANTQLQFAGSQQRNSQMGMKIARFINERVAQSAEMGSYPTLYAATAPDVRGGDYIGPDRWFETRGYPTKVQANASAHDIVTARQLWEVSEQLTGIQYCFA